MTMLQNRATLQTNQCQIAKLKEQLAVCSDQCDEQVSHVIYAFVHIYVYDAYYCTTEKGDMVYENLLAKILNFHLDIYMYIYIIQQFSLKYVVF